MNTSKPSFNYRAQQAALLESANIASTIMASMSRSTQPQSEVSNRSFLFFNFDDTQQTNIQTYYIDSDNPDNATHVILTSNSPSDFRRTSPNSPTPTATDIIAPLGEQPSCPSTKIDRTRSHSSIDNRTPNSIRRGRHNRSKS